MSVAQDFPSQRRIAELAETIRRFQRRGARRNVSRLLGRVRPQDVALILEQLDAAQQSQVFRIACSDFPDTAGEVLIGMEHGRMVRLLEQLKPEEIAGVVTTMEVDDAVLVVDSLAEELRGSVLALVDLRRHDDLHTQLGYADDTAGRVMNPKFFSLPEDTPAGEAIAKIQRLEDVEMIFYLYVTGKEGELVGVTSLRQLLLSPPERPLREIMNPSVIKVTTETDQEQVARLASRYGLLAIPVTDQFNRLAGIVTVDDVIDIFREEADEDFYKMVGTSEDELLYREKAWKVARIRMPWLLINLAGLCVTSLLFKAFEVTLREAIFLVFFAPVIMGMGGNIGSQTSTIAVRGLATGRISNERGRIRGFVWQQLRVGLLLGLCFAPLAGAGAFLLEGSWALGVVVGVALFAAVSIAAVNGSLVPLFFERMGIDPAVAAGPMVTTTSDIVGICIYFGTAAGMLRWIVA